MELSAELLEAHAEYQQGFAAEQRFRLDVAIVEAAPRILGGLPDKISSQATTALERKGVRVLTGAKVLHVHEGGLETSIGEIRAELVIWAAGVKASAANLELGLVTNRANQFVVDERLRASIPDIYAPDIYAMGDCAACVWPSEGPDATERLVAGSGLRRRISRRAIWLRSCWPACVSVISKSRSFIATSALWCPWARGAGWAR